MGFTRLKPRCVLRAALLSEGSRGEPVFSSSEPLTAAHLPWLLALPIFKVSNGVYYTLRYPDTGSSDSHFHVEGL